ncbi:hypothetical protein BST81_08965 [Leptolyngbya sp. 'hensonii']|uniref:hypothetical protein n=1 Tax=Leptolyngbya sp. 'hensonii' TaxID=1922337 RepID=UPI00094F8836|nr:hypothetical protein [Leptolyngbya sp. 'hensonii']OLP18765.1 hypothetical protein BST81_08965 [Leptolyngbya sp. 'hensonii']
MEKDPVFSPEQFITWLFQGSGSASTNTPWEVSSTIDCSGGAAVEPFTPNGVHASSVDGLDELESIILESFDGEAIDLLADALQDFSPQSGHGTLKLGEISTVHDRFYTLIKRRLEAEIQLHPPLFPWETELVDYESDVSVVEEPVAGLWLAQLRRLNLPVPMPQEILTQLLQHCQNLVQTPLREGAKLVQAVESFFPEDSQLLNHLAGQVLLSPSRGSAAPAPVRETMPDDYATANPTQQMVLSLLAAREILRSLTLTVSASQPIVEREWLTQAGPLTLQLHYEVQPEARLQVQAHLPSGGRLTLQTSAAQASASRDNGGSLILEVSNLPLDWTAVLEVQLQTAVQTPLTFAISPAER